MKENAITNNKLYKEADDFRMKSVFGPFLLYLLMGAPINRTTCSVPQSSCSLKGFSVIMMFQIHHYFSGYKLMCLCSSFGYNVFFKGIFTLIFNQFLAVNTKMSNDKCPQTPQVDKHAWQFYQKEITHKQMIHYPTLSVTRYYFGC